MGESSTVQPGALFVNPSTSLGQAAPVTSWISVAGWASAARQLWGASWIVTPQGVLSPEEALRLASLPQLKPRPRPSWRRFVPETLKTALKDARKAFDARRFRTAALEGPWRDLPLHFVWQRHDLFHDAGLVAARHLRRPAVLFVPALLVWEAGKWGVGRPGWAGVLERRAERPQLLAADLVACGSDELAERLTDHLGVPSERILVTPNGVDPDRFSPQISGERVRARLGLDDAFVVGWVGSFRRFHGLDMALEAMRLLQDRIPEASLLLVGDGAERARLEHRADELGLRNVIMTGTVGFLEIPEHVAAMDVALITDRGERQYHYSPLKLREYMAGGKAVVAASVGEMGRWLSDGVDAVLVESGDVSGLADSVELLHDRPEMRDALGSAARQKVLREATWAIQLQRIDRALGERASAGSSV